MNGHKIENISAVISYIEAHLNEKLDLDTVASAVCYSKYHLHRMFTDTVGITLHDYIQRRQLTEAAKLLVFSEKPIIEALNPGISRVKRSRCRSSQEVNDSPTPFSAFNHCLLSSVRASFSLSKPNIAAYATRKPRTTAATTMYHATAMALI